MALAARCPHCSALFRVVADQLKLRGGLVRCGECRQVFDAIGSLSYVDSHSLVPARGEAPIGGTAVPGPAAFASAAAASVPAPARAREPVLAAPALRPSAPPPVWVPERRPALDLEEVADALSVPTLIGSTEPDRAANRSEAQAKAPGSRIEPTLAQRSAGSSARSSTHRVTPEPSGSDPRSDYQSLSTADDGDEAAVEAAPDELDAEAPSFLLTPDQRRQRRLRWLLASAPLAVLAVIQIGLALRDNLLEAWPSLHPLLGRACSLYGCTVGWPTHAELLTIVGSELAAIPGTDAIELNAAIRSRAPFVMGLPAIEVTLTDSLNRTIARKVFLPVDYLASSGEASSRIDEGLVPDSDLSIRLVFEARGLNASGFIVYPFYL
jgi:predicted Zn finger-like uncharacterized protein